MSRMSRRAGKYRENLLSIRPIIYCSQRIRRRIISLCFVSIREPANCLRPGIRLASRLLFALSSCCRRNSQVFVGVTQTRASSSQGICPAQTHVVVFSGCRYDPVTRPISAGYRDSSLHRICSEVPAGMPNRSCSSWLNG